MLPLAMESVEVGTPAIHTHIAVAASSLDANTSVSITITCKCNETECNDTDIGTDTECNDTKSNDTSPAGAVDMLYLEEHIDSSQQLFVTQSHAWKPA